MIIYHSKDYQRGPKVLFWPKALTFTKQEMLKLVMYYSLLLPNKDISSGPHVKNSH